MSTTPTTAAAVEAVAQVLWTIAFEDERDPTPWAEADDGDRKDCLDTARRVVEAAALVLLAAPDGPWHAYLTDLYGQVLDIEDLPHGALANGGRIVICRDSALPSGELMPGTWTTSDLFLELDFDDYETVEEATEAWHMAVAAAEGMNRAIARGSQPADGGGGEAP